jgi:hypothetical protein
MRARQRSASARPGRFCSRAPPISKEPTSGKSHLPHSRAGALRAEHESGGVSRGRSGPVAIIGYEVGPRGRASGGIKIDAVDSSQMAFEIAAKAVFRQTMPKAAPNSSSRS